MLRESERAVAPPIVVIDDEPAQGDSDIGIMEFADWLAGCSDTELITIGLEHGVALGHIESTPLTEKQRYYYGLDVWASL